MISLLYSHLLSHTINAVIFFTKFFRVFYIFWPRVSKLWSCWINTGDNMMNTRQKVKGFFTAEDNSYIFRFIILKNQNKLVYLF